MKVCSLIIFNNNNNKFDIIKDKFANDFNKRKQNNENFEKNENKVNEMINSKNNNKNDKKFKFDNFNKKFVKNKNNNKLYRFIKIEYENIKINNKCYDCDQSNCNWKICKNKKSNVHSKKIALDSKTKN